MKIFNNLRVNIRRWQPLIVLGMSSGFKVLQPFGFHGFCLAIPSCFGSSLSAQSRSEKPQAGAVRGRHGGFLGWVEVFCFRDCLAKTWGWRGGWAVAVVYQGIDFFERCICKHSDDFVEFCEFQSSIKQPAISVQCLILDRRQAIGSLAGCLAIYTYCSLIGQIGSGSQRVTSLWNEGLNARHQVWACYFQSGPTFSDSVYIYIYYYFLFFIFSRILKKHLAQMTSNLFPQMCIHHPP